jgi:uncharacterized protein (DUF1778 family)
MGIASNRRKAKSAPVATLSQKRILLRIAICNTMIKEGDHMAVRKLKSQRPTTNTLMVRLDKESKEALVQAATLRKISVSDYVRVVTVPQARKEVLASVDQTISLSAAEQLAFWTALNNSTKLTTAQKKLGKLMRGEP